MTVPAESPVRSLGWSWLGTAVAGVMQIAYAAMVARLVAPAAFGAIAGALLLLRFVAYIAKLGVAQALIQQESLTARDINAAHQVSVLAGLIGALVGVLAAPIAGYVLRSPEVEVATRWLSAGLLLNGLSAVPDALLRRAGRFRVLAGAQIVSYLISNLILALVLAVAGFDLGALLAAYIGGWVLDALLLTMLCGSRPRLFTRFASPRGGLLRFGGVVSLASLLDVVTSSIDTLLVGRIGAAELGQYNRGTMLVGLPLQQASGAANRVAAPRLARAQVDRRKFVEMTSSAFGITGLAAFSLAAFAGAAAPALVRVVLGPGWELAAALLPALALAQGLWVVTQVLVTAAESTGAVAQRLRAQVCATLSGVVLIVGAYVVVGSPMALAIAWLAAEAARLAVHLVMAVRHLGVSSLQARRRLSSALLVGLAVAGPPLMFIRGIDIAPLLGLGVSAVLSAVLVVVMWFGLPKSQVRLDLQLLGIRRMAGRSIDTEVRR